MTTFLITLAFLLFAMSVTHPIFTFLGLTCLGLAVKYHRDEIHIRDAADMDRPE